MISISAEQWSGTLRADNTIEVTGLINGYSWLLQSKSNSWVLEIAEEKAIKSDDLPLVGFGCAGWLYESGSVILPTNEADIIRYLNQQLDVVFHLFSQNKLTYLPAVICPCSD